MCNETCESIKAKTKENVAKAREVLHKILEELKPAKEHFLAANKELLLAIRSAIDAEIRLVEKVAKGSGDEKAGDS
ncbi:MAG: hypothetical protein QGD94_03250 [Planctomycetia bacterium]|nr:hypothetical protein [Planctomycetia bacterium]